MPLSPLSIDINEQLTKVTGFGRPFGLKVMQDGTTYVTDMDLHALFRIASDLYTYQVLTGPDGWSAPTPFIPGQQQQVKPQRPECFNGPHSLDVSPSGQMCVTTYYTPALHFLTPDGGLERTVQHLSPNITLTGPATSIYTNDGALLISEYAQNTILTWHPQDGLIDTIGTAKNKIVSLDRPHMAKQLSCGALVIVDTWNHRLVRIAPDGTLAGWWGASTDRDNVGGWRHEMVVSVASNASGGLQAPVAVDEDPSTGDLLVTDWGNNRLLWLHPDGQVTASLTSFDLKKPYDARFFRKGLVIADSHHGRVLFVNALKST